MAYAPWTRIVECYVDHSVCHTIIIFLLDLISLSLNKYHNFNHLFPSYHGERIQIALEHFWAQKEWKKIQVLLPTSNSLFNGYTCELTSTNNMNYLSCFNWVLWKAKRNNQNSFPNFLLYNVNYMFWAWFCLFITFLERLIFEKATSLKIS